MSLPHRPRRMAARLSWSLLALLLAGPVTVAGEEVGRIVAIGDIHGAYEELLSILRASELVDEEGAWIGGQATLVQLGDFTDRGSGVKQVMDLLVGLQAGAATAGGRVIVVLGNHEVMNLMGELRDVTPEIFATFVTAERDGRREESWKAWVALLKTRASWRGEPFTPPDEAARREFLAARPPGYFEYVEALGPEGAYGRWIRSLPAVAQVGETLFAHGGISPELASRSLDAINDTVARELREFDGIKQRLVDLGVALPHDTLAEIHDSVSHLIEALEREPQRVGSKRRVATLVAAIRDLSGMREWLSFSPDGPLWLRDYARWNEDDGDEASSQILEAYGAERIVVGHTPPRPPSNIQMRFGGRVYLTDTGMLEGHYPGGRPSALEIVGERITAIYEDERVVLMEGSRDPVPASAGPVERSMALRGAGAPGTRGGYVLASTPDRQEPRADESLSSKRETAGRWIGPDGEPLPLQLDEDLLELLREGRILSMKHIPTGVTNPKKLLLEKNGVRTHAVFRYVHEVRVQQRLADGKVHMFFRDSHTGEPAAYEMDRLLDLGRVPPSTPRTLPRLGRGSIQLWIENAMTEHDRRRREIEPPDRPRFIRELHNVRVFDNLVNNIDRNQGNILIDPDWKIWYIDCTRCFARTRQLPNPEWIRRIERGFWERLQSLDHDLVRERMHPYLSRFEIRALLERHEKLVRLIRDRIDELGEEAVLFTFEDEADPSSSEPVEMPELPPPTEPPVPEPEEALEDLAPTPRAWHAR